MADIPFSLHMKVRDYECDMQGIVNNAIYQHYLEHARHEYLLSRGFSFPDLTARGIILVVVRAEIDYRRSLRAGDEFAVTVKPVRPSPVKLVFQQSILHGPQQTLMLNAQITTTAINERNRPYFPEELARLLES